MAVSPKAVPNTEMQQKISELVTTVMKKAAELQMTTAQVRNAIQLVAQKVDSQVVQYTEE